MNRARAEAQGRRAEQWAALYLRAKGWRILARRARVGHGEVDIIARRGHTIAFVEVKWRANAAALTDAIHAHSLRRVVAAAEILAPRYAKAADQVRIDAILLAPWRWPHHLPHIWVKEG